MAKNSKESDKKMKMKKDEPVFIVRAATKNWGLDYFHITLIALVIVLVALAFALSLFKPGAVVNSCSYGVTANGTCISLPYSTNEVLQTVGKYLAGYSLANSSLSILPYYSKFNESNVSYLPQQNEWFVRVPYLDPFESNKTFNVSFVLSHNLSIENVFISTIRPYTGGNDSTVALGAVKINGKNFCNYSTPIPTYLITDPYAPGAIPAMQKAVNITNEYNGKVNVLYYFIFSGFSESHYAGYGVGETQALGKYLACTSLQSQFGTFLTNLNVAYTGNPLPNATLSLVAADSGINSTRLNTCMETVSTALDNQAVLANLYNVTSVPIFIVNCKYMSIPQTTNYAINYTLDQLTKK